MRAKGFALNVAAQASKATKKKAEAEASPVIPLITAASMSSIKTELCSINLTMSRLIFRLLRMFSSLWAISALRASDPTRPPAGRVLSPQPLQQPHQDPRQLVHYRRRGQGPTGGHGKYRPNQCQRHHHCQ